MIRGFLDGVCLAWAEKPKGRKGSFKTFRSFNLTVIRGKTGQKTGKFGGKPGRERGKTRQKPGENRAEPTVNQYIKSAVELIRSNKTFRSKVKFSLELTENDMIHAVPAEVLDRLVACISEEAMRMLNGGEYRVTVGTAYQDGQRSIRIGNAVSTFRYRSPDSPKVSGDLLSPCRCTVTPATPHGRGATAASKTPPGPSPLRA